MLMLAGKHLFKLVSVLLCAALMLGITPLSAAAEENSNVIDIAKIGNYGVVDNGDWAFDGNNTFIINNKVTVTGLNYNGEALVFDIRNNSSVTWTAAYSGQSEYEDYVLLDVRGKGIFTVESGGDILLDNGGTALKAESDISVVIGSGGSVGAGNGDGSCIAIEAYGSVLVSDGKIACGNNLGGSTAIYAGGDVTVAGSSSISFSNKNTCSVAIRSDQDVDILVGDSSITGNSAIIANKATVTVSGNAVVGVNNFLTYVNEEFIGNAITAKNVTVEDNAKVMALNGAAIIYSGKLEIHGGAVIAFGDGIGGAEFEITDELLDDSKDGEWPMLNAIFKTQDLNISKNVKYSDSSDIASCVSDDGIVMVWEYMKFYEAGGKFYYKDGDRTDIIAYPEEGLDYGWLVTKNQVSIIYNKGVTNGEFVLNNRMSLKPMKYNPKKEPKPEEPNPGTGNNNGNNNGNNSSNMPGNPGGSFSGSGSFAKGSGTGIVYTVNKDFSQFNSVMVGKSTLTSNRDYIAESGSTKITLLPAYLDTLAAGTYTLTVAFTDNTSATVSFTVAEGQKLPFTDVPSDGWYYNAVNYVYTKGLIVGTAADKFSPGSALSRGMIVTILYRNAGEPSVSGYANPFSDVPDNTWYTDAVKWAAAGGIVAGYGNGKFGPEDDVTKEQLALIIYRIQQSSGKTPTDIGTDKTFADAAKISAWAQDAVSELNRQGLFQDLPGNNFDPQNSASRAETASILYRYLTAVQ